MTGAPMPAGADAVVMVEHTDARPTTTRSCSCAEAVAPGNHVRAGRRRPRGRATRCSPPGDRARPPATSACWPRIGVTERRGRARRPGSACCPPATSWSTAARPLRPGQIRDSNRPHAAGAASRRPAATASTSACVARRRGRHRPRPSRDGVGDCDALAHERRREHGRLRLREGRARPHRRHALDAGRDQAGQAVGLRHRHRSDGRPVPVFGLPGNPVSSMVTFELFARPGLRPMMGHADADLDRPRVRAVADEPPAPPTRRQGPLRPGRVPHGDGRPRSTSRSAGGQGSPPADAPWPAPTRLAVLPDGDGVDAGDRARRAARPTSVP